MPNKASAKKRARQNEARNVRNRAARSDMRTHIKTAKRMIDEKNVDAIDEAVRQAQVKLAKGAKRNLIKKNNASRKQSRLMKAAAKAKKAVAAE